MGRIALISVMTACLALATPAGAQDEPRPLDGWSTAAELVEALDRDDGEGMAFLGGVLGTLMLRSVQGDPMLWWANRCIAEKYLMAESLVPGLRDWSAGHPDLSPHANFAANAILQVFAETCGETLGALLPAE